MFDSELERDMYQSQGKNIILIDKWGKTHRVKNHLYTPSADNENGLPSVALSDGLWLYINQIVSIEILDD